MQHPQCCCQFNGYVEICEWFYYKIHSPLMEAAFQSMHFGSGVFWGEGD